MPKTNQPKEKIQEGQRFKNGGYTYIMARTGENQFRLINLTGGNRWTDGRFNTPEKAFGGCRKEFTKVD